MQLAAMERRRDHRAGGRAPRRRTPAGTRSGPGPRRRTADASEPGV